MNKVIQDLFTTIEARKGENPNNSWSAKLFDMGTETICEKVMEEAGETVAEAIAGNNKKLIYESADLLYHLMVLWADRGITPDEVMTELTSRMGTSGIVEKQSRK